MKTQALVVKGDQLLILTFDSLSEFNDTWPLLAKQGYKSYFGYLQDGIATKVVDKFMGEIDQMELQQTLSCPRTGHGTSKIWSDRKDPRKHYCGHKINGDWCGIAWDENGVMIDKRQQ